MEGEEIELPESKSSEQGVVNESADVLKPVSASTLQEPEPGREQTIGEQRVRTSFNPDQNGVVDHIKQKTAELINLCEQLKAKDGRLASLAQTEYESAAMWAVKAATA